MKFSNINRSNEKLTRVYRIASSFNDKLGKNKFFSAHRFHFSQLEFEQLCYAIFIQCKQTILELFSCFTILLRTTWAFEKVVFGPMAKKYWKFMKKIGSLFLK